MSRLPHRSLRRAQPTPRTEAAARLISSVAELAARVADEVTQLAALAAATPPSPVAARRHTGSVGAKVSP